MVYSTEEQNLTTTQLSQWDCFILSCQHKLCSLFAVHKKELSLLYHTFRQENA